METLGFIFGLSGLSFGLIAYQQLEQLKEQFDDLKKDLTDSGYIK